MSDSSDEDFYMEPDDESDDGGVDVDQDSDSQDEVDDGDEESEEDDGEEDDGESDFEDSQAEEVSDEDIEEEEEDEEDGPVFDQTSFIDDGPVEYRGSPPPASSQRRMRRALPSSSEDEGTAGAAGHSSPVRQRKKKARRKLSSSSSSNDDDDQPASPAAPDSDTCPICLLRMREQELGRPDVCSHLFCAECIVEWSRNVATCPIDRKPMRSIHVTKGGVEVRQHRVKTRRIQEVEEEFLDPESVYDTTCFCELCRSGEREEVLLLCDGCDLAYHTDCLTPPLGSIPRGRWYCPTCEAAGVGTARRNEEVSRRRVSSSHNDSRRRRRRRSDQQNDQQGERSVDDETLGGFIVPDEEVEDCFDDGDESSDEDVEVMPRTMQTSRIERAMQDRRRSQVAAAAAAERTTVRKKTTTKKKRKSSTKRKTTKRKVTKKKTTTKTTTTKSGKKRKVKKRKTVRKTKTTRRKKRKSSSPKKGKGKGKGKSSSNTSKSESVRTDLGPSLSLFGSKNDLDFHGDDEMLYANPEPGPSGINSGNTSANSQISRTVSAASSSSSSQDLLSELMSCQKRTLSPQKSSTGSQKLPEVYKKSEEKQDQSVSRTISTSVTQYQSRQEMIKRQEKEERRRRREEALKEKERVSDLKKSLSTPTKIDNFEESAENDERSTSTKNQSRDNNSVNSSTEHESLSVKREQTDDSHNNSMFSKCMSAPTGSIFKTSVKQELTSESAIKQEFSESSIKQELSWTCSSESSSSKSSNHELKRKQEQSHSYTAPKRPKTVSESPAEKVEKSYGNEGVGESSTNSFGQPNHAQQLASIMVAVKKQLKPRYHSGQISGHQYKAILKKCVEKIYRKCKDDQTRLFPEKVRKLVDAYVQIEKY